MRRRMVNYLFPSVRLKGKKPLAAPIMVLKYLRPAAIKTDVIKEDGRARFGFHNFQHSLASSLVKLKCDPKTVQGILRHEDATSARRSDRPAHRDDPVDVCWARP